MAVFVDLGFYFEFKSRLNYLVFEYIEDYEVDSDYRKNWNRMDHINTDEWDWYSLESKYLDLEKEENKKKYEKKLIIKKKNS